MCDIKLDFILLIYLMSIQFLDKPEESRKDRGKLFPSPTSLNNLRISLITINENSKS